MKKFIDTEGKLDKEALRLFTLSELTALQTELYPLYSHDSGGFFDKLHDAIALANKENLPVYKIIESQLSSLPEFISSFIQTALDSRERLEFFIQVKANEIVDGDQHHAYFWAQMIRHDQLLATYLVLKDVAALIKRWSLLTPSEILTSKAFLTLATETIEDRIYLKAKALSESRP